MDIEDAGGRKVEDRLRDDLAVVGEDAEAGSERTDRSDGLRPPQARRLEHRQAELARTRRHRRGRRAAPPTGGLVRDGDDAGDRHLGRREQGLEDRDGERSRPEEDGRDRPGHASAVARCSASSSSLSSAKEMSSSIESR